MAKDAVRKGKRCLTPALVYHTDITVKRARGLYIDAADGRRYMDFTSGLATVNIGHCPPKVAAAAKKQLESLIHSGCIFRYDSIIELSERLTKITPGDIGMFFYSNSGAEAVEGAIKLARYVTGRQGIIAFTGAFHGRTFGALSLTSSRALYRKHYHSLLPSVYHAPYPYCYRCFLGKKRETCSLECFTMLERMMEHVIAPEEVASFIIEPVLGEGGYAPAPKEYMKRLAALAKKHGIMLIADEVQSGMGRTGKWFASEHYGIKPDIMTIAKGIASGFPISVVASTPAIMKKWERGAHGTTFGGNPVSAAAAVATIDVIEEEKLLENARRMGEYAMDRLREMKRRLTIIGDVRGMGLMIGIELVKKDGSPNPQAMEKTIRLCEKAGLIIVECGKDKNVARLMPPINVTQKEMDAALLILEKTLKAVS